ncbi:blastula protease 10-like isoform X2 [Littorina saxatilis]|uniref:blastula protease 10-like isoform X2 n=1 Tax=Littorina saxatilis TaxID=31220 RepID=UPI0038B6137B
MCVMLHPLHDLSLTALRRIEDREKSTVMFRQSWVFVILTLIQVTTAAVLNLTTDEVISKAMEKSDRNSPEQNDSTEIRTELDMILTPEQAEAMYGEATRPQARKARRNEKYRWPGGVIPYEIDSALYYSSKKRSTILGAIREWETYTCIEFRRTNGADENYVRFIDGDGCSSSVGMIGNGIHNITLNNVCFLSVDGGHSTVVHEIGHTVGFWHEQSRPDRDRYVKILYKNVQENRVHNFRRYSDSLIDTYSVPYDYRSVMHYGKAFFSKDKRTLLTIETTDKSYQDIIGTAKGLSFRDIKLANLMYNCNAGCSNQSVTCPGEGFVDKSCRCMCPGDPTQECTRPDVNECASNPCRNGGTCNNLDGRYTCTCPPGFNGTTCQFSVNECASNPCLNGGTCRDGSGNYTCACRTGFTGSRCQTVTCSDDFSVCAAWSNIVCANTYLADKCRKTCRRCSQVTCSDDFSWCAAWSNTVCATTYLADKCRKTCRRCSRE